MSSRMRLLTLAVAVFASSLAMTAALGKDLPSDPRIVTGKLDNGLTWMFRKHDNPPGKMAMQLHMRSGSLNETDAQQGLAHFMEHMSFNGSEHFAAGKLMEYFESIGMQFGYDVNAFTSFDQIVYQIYLPDTTKEHIEKALTVQSDQAFRLLLLDEEIDNERGVILEESRTGKNAGQRIRDKLWPELFEGSRFAHRMIIGKDEIIANAPREEFVDFYRTWYRPENATLVLVGDTDHEWIIPLIEKWFGQYKPTAPTRTPPGPEFKPFTKQRAMVVTDPEQTSCRVQMWNLRPGRPPTVTVEQARTELVEYVGTWIFDRRCEERINKGEASYLSASGGIMSFFHDTMVTLGTATGEPEDWNKMLEELVIEVNRARQFGFTEHEWELAKKEILADAEQAVRSEPTRSANGIIAEIVSGVNSREPVLSAQQELDLYKEHLPTIDLDEINATFKRYFAPGTFAYVIVTNEKEGVDVPGRDDVLAAARAAWARTVTPVEEEKAPTTLLASEPIPGKVVETATRADLGVTSAWLDNGVRFHHRYMDYKKDLVFVSIALAGGQIEETTENAGITTVARLAVLQAATHRLSSTNIRDIMTGKSIRISATDPGDALTIQLIGSPKDLEIGLQEAHALLIDGKIEESAFKTWKQGTLQQLEAYEKLPRVRAFQTLAEVMGGGDPRLTSMSKEKVANQSIEKAQAWYDRLCREAPIEVAVVGDIQLAKAQSLIEKYIGSLSKRPRSTGYLDKLRKVNRPAGPWTRHIDVETITPQGMTLFGFAGCHGRNTYDRLALDIAAQILNNRIIKRIREELALAYSPQSMHRPVWVYEDAGVLLGMAACDPENTQKTADEFELLFEQLAKTPPTEEELENAKKQIGNDLDTALKEPGYWWNILSYHDLHGRDLDVEKGAREASKKYTAEQVRAVFAKYFTPARQVRITAVPVASESAETETKEKEKEKAAVPSA